MLRVGNMTVASQVRPIDRYSFHIHFTLGMLASPAFFLCHRMKWYIVYLFLIRCLPVNAAEEEYREELTLRPLIDGKVAAHFSFSTLLHGAVPRAPSTLGTDDICMSCIHPTPTLLTAEYLFQAQHYSIFPLALGQILREHAIPEFHLTMNSGKWDYDRWGHPGEPGVGSGAELWAWMGEGDVAETRYQSRPKSSSPFFFPGYYPLSQRERKS